MKISSLPVGLFLTSLLASASAQALTGTATQSAPVAPLPPTSYQVIDAGPNHRKWHWQTFELLSNGKILAHDHNLTELASGLNVQDSKTGKWTPAQDLIEPYAQGAIAHLGQTKIIFANNLNTAGAVDEETPEGKRLTTSVIGLLYDDPGSGQSVQIASVQDSEGQLVAANQVLYTNAFNGVRASVRFTYRRDGTEQDIILDGQPPAPESFGLRSDTADLIVVTEFINPPEATISAAQDEDGDQAISWGATSLGRGKAFSIRGTDIPVAVRKEYLDINGRYFLFEKVRYRDIQGAVSKLPAQTSNAHTFKVMASRKLNFPKRVTVKRALRPMKLAFNQGPDKGYVLDYVTLNATYTNYTFQGDSTYYISGNVNLAGTNNCFEGGTVIKNAANTSIAIVSGGAVKFASTPYRPVVFTAQDDNTLGETISGSTGSPSGYYADPALNLSSLGSLALSEFRILYANRGLSVSGASPAVYDAQFVNCALAVSEINGNVTLENVLFSNIKTNFNCTSTTNTIYCQNATFNNTFSLNSGNYASTWLYLTNCAFVNVTNMSGNLVAGYNGFYQSPMVGAPAVTNTFYPLQRAGGGNCYLTNGCSFFTNGISGVDLYGLWLINQKTTQAPLVFSNLTFSVATNFGPRVVRDTNASPSLGYHYDPIDYAFGGVNVYSNITFTAGTSVGWFQLPGSGGTGYGVTLFDKVVFSFIGTASCPCVWAHCPTVQEGGNGLWTDRGYFAGIVTATQNNGYGMNPTNAAVTMANFGHFFAMAADPNLFRENNALSQVYAQNSEFHGAGIGAYWDYLGATNCLFDRTSAGVGGTQSAQYWMRNCAMRGAGLTFAESGPTWIEDCAFDGTSLSVTYTGNTNVTYMDFNAFITNGTSLTAPGTHNVYVTNFNWQSSWSGNFYLPAGSPLVDHGSTTADRIGLYHFTTQTSQMKETNSLADIGYHYVAASGNGMPIDSNSDGLPDYQEDPNGNGLVDTGESPWMPPPIITTQPSSLTLIQGSNATFHVSATSPVPASYQWYFNVTNLLSGATNSTLSILNVQPANAGNYSVTVANAAGSVNSSNALLLVGLPPSFSTQPASSLVMQGGAATFTSTAAGTSPLKYQWYFNSTNLMAGATNATLVFTNGQPANAGYYSVSVTNNFGAITSSAAGLTVASWTVTNPIAIQGGTASFGISLTGPAFCNGQLNYQWQHNGTNVGNIITTVAGNFSMGGNYSGDGYAATNAGLYGPNVIAVDKLANLYIAETGSSVIRKVGTNGIIMTVAGNYGMRYGYSGDGSAATNAALNEPSGITVGPDGNLYIADYFNNVIRKVDTNGIITTVVGDYNQGWNYSGDGDLAINAGLTTPRTVTFDAGGNLYIADAGNNVVRKVDTNGIITTIAGDYNSGGGYSGDGDLAVNAGLNSPADLMFDSRGNLYIDDSGNNVVRMVDTNGIITTVVGNYNSGGTYSGDGGASTNAGFNGLSGAFVTSSGQIYTPDYYNGVVRRTDTNGLIQAVVGNYNLRGGYSGDGGIATNAGLTYPIYCVVDGGGNIYVCDSGNEVIRKVVSPGNLNIAGGAIGITNATTDNAGSYQVTISSPCGNINSSAIMLAVMSWTKDSDYDGRSDAQEIIDGTDPFNPNSVAQVRLGYLPFDNTNTWVGSAGQLPLRVTNIVGITGMIGNAARIDNTNGVFLCYRDVETNGNANINLRNGTISFWFKPDWSSADLGGTGPGAAGQMVGLGQFAPAVSTNDGTIYFTNGWWSLFLSPDGNELSFGSSTNGAGGANLTADIAWLSNQWHQVVLTYSPANSALFVDGQLLTNGTGSVSYPNLAERSVGIWVGSDQNGNNQVAGTFDELETFNYQRDAFSSGTPQITSQPSDQVCASNGVANFSVTVSCATPLIYQWYYNITNPISGATNSSLTISNMQPFYAGNYSVVVVNNFGSTTSAVANLNMPTRLAYWAFDDTNVWGGAQGQLPLVLTNVVGVPSWDTNAVWIDNTNPVLLSYRAIETNGNANINLINGTVQFGFEPDWASGVGPGFAGRLLEFGSQNSSNGCWTLEFSPDGTSLAFITQTNGICITNCQAAINWTSNQWHQITLAYTLQNSRLYIDGQQAATGGGNLYHPNLSGLTNGFRIGSDANGLSQARGAFENLETFNYAFTISDITNPPAIAYSSAFGQMPCNYSISYIITRYPTISDAFSIPEPGLVNEAVTVYGQTLVLPGTYTVYGYSYYCPPIIIPNVLWNLGANLYWSASFSTSPTWVNGSVGSGGLTIPNGSGLDFFSFSFTPSEAGEGKVGISVFAAGQAPKNPIYATTPPNNPAILPFSVFPPERLMYLAFDENSLAGDGGQIPTIHNNVTSFVPSPFGQALNCDNGLDMDLEYAVFQNDRIPVNEPDGSIIYSTGTPNIRWNEGTVRFWFKPNWTTGSGPATGGVFLKMAGGGWLLQVTNTDTGSGTITGSAIELDSGTSVVLKQSINWTDSSKWHQIAIVYSHSSTTLYIDGAAVGGGYPLPNIAIDPLATFKIGSDGADRQVQGIMDKLETFNYQLTSSAISAGYIGDSTLDANGDGIPDLLEFEQGIDPWNPPAQNPTVDPNPSPGDTTPPTINLVQPINAY